MTNPKYIIGLFMLFGVCTIIMGIIEGIPYGSDETTKLYDLMKPSFSLGYLGNLWDMFWFDYPFLTGNLLYVKYVIFWPMSIGLIVSFVVGIVSGLGGLLRGFV